MNCNRTRIIMLGAAAFIVSTVLPAHLSAQMDPMSTPASATQPNRPQQQQPSATSLQDSASNAGDVGQIMKDKIFLRSAAENSIAELKFGELAVEKATSEDVKAFGQKMIDDHEQLKTDLANIADAAGIRLPKDMNKADQAEYERLKTLSGSDFETAYITRMIKGHHRAMRDFRVEAMGSPDQDLRDFVTKGEHVIHEHLVMVNKLAKDKGVPMPQRGSKHAPPPAS